AKWATAERRLGQAHGWQRWSLVSKPTTTWIGDDDNILAAIEVAAAGDDAADRWGARRQALPGGRGCEEKYRTGGQSIHDVLLRAQVRDVALTVEVQTRQVFEVEGDDAQLVKTIAGPGMRDQRADRLNVIQRVDGPAQERHEEDNRAHNEA